MRELIIIRGAPGSGKTTLAMDMIKTGQADVCYEADLYFTKPNGTYKFDPKRLMNAHEWCFRSVTRELTLPLPKTVIVSNTFTRLWEMENYINFCTDHKIPFRVFRCDGKFKNVHGVPDEKVQKMRDRLEDYPNETIIHGS